MHFLAVQSIFFIHVKIFVSSNFLYIFLTIIFENQWKNKNKN